MNKKYREFLKNTIDKYCVDGKYTICPSYDDSIPVEIIKLAYERALKYGDNFAEVLENETCANVFDHLYPDDYFNLVYKEADISNDVEIIACVRTDDSLFEHLCEAGFKGFKYDFNTLLKQTHICLTVGLGTEQEQNYDMSSIISAYGCWHMPYAEDMNEKVFDNALTYLIHQQGHSVKEVFECLIANPKGFAETQDGEFVKSVVNEIVNNNSDGLSEVIFLIKQEGENIVDFFDNLIKKDFNYKIPLKKGFNIGLFNEWSGCGSLLELQLEKDFVFSPELIRDVDMSTDSDNLVGRVYGVSSEFWADTPITYTKETSEIFEEKDSVFEDIKQLISLEENDVA